LFSIKILREVSTEIDVRKFHSILFKVYRNKCVVEPNVFIEIKCEENKLKGKLLNNPKNYIGKINIF